MPWGRLDQSAERSRQLFVHFWALACVSLRRCAHSLPSGLHLENPKERWRTGRLRRHPYLEPHVLSRVARPFPLVGCPPRGCGERERLQRLGCLLLVVLRLRHWGGRRFRSRQRVGQQLHQRVHLQRQLRRNPRVQQQLRVILGVQQQQLQFVVVVLDVRVLQLGQLEQ